MRDAWKTGGSSHHGGPAGGNDVRVTGAPSGSGFPFSTVFGVLIVAAIGYAAWKYGPALAEKFHTASAAENASETYVNAIATQSPSEESLAEAARNGVGDALMVHAARGTKWYVAYGPNGGDVKPHVLRDDDFKDDAHQFFDGLIAEGGKGAATGMKKGPKDSGLVARWRSVSLPYDSRTWRVVVGWTEK